VAINEACQVWIEQRIQEELEEKGDSGKSLRQIGREIASEIERIFEAKISPMTVYHHVRKGDRNQSPPETPHPATVKPGSVGQDETTIYTEVDAKVRRGASIREATKEIASIYGKSHESIRNVYRREKEKRDYPCTVSQAMDFAEMAILQLERIRVDDPQRRDAFDRVVTWIENHRGN
jgi:hypothetical protein